MTPSGIITLYLIFFGVEFLFEYLLAGLNNRSISKNRHNIPPVFQDSIDENTYKKSCAYGLTRGYFGMAAGAVAAIIVLVVVLSGLLGAIDTWLSGLRLPPGIQGIIFVAIIAGIFHIAGLPAAIFSRFVIEQRFGFNTMKAGAFFVDEIKGLALSAIVGFPILLGLFWFVRSAGPMWWVYAFFAITAFQLAISVVYPLLIAPLFNKFTPLEEGALRTSIEDLAGRLEFSTSGIYLMDGSKRSRHSNAYFTGIGKTKRIVLFDTLVEKLTEDQILAVLAHEIGHQKKKHIIKRLAVSLLITFGAFWLINRLLSWDALFTAFSFGRPTIHGLLVILSFCSGPFTFMLTPLFTGWSRRHEYQADRYAAESGNRAGDLKSALLSLGRENLSTLTPHRLYSFFHYSHPTLAERASFLDTLSSG